MSGHSWRRLPDPLVEVWPGPGLREALPEMYGSLEPVLEVRRLWRCSKCDSAVEARGQEKLCEARRRAKVPHDCDTTVVRSVMKS